MRCSNAAEMLQVNANPLDGAAAAVSHLCTLATIELSF